MKRTDCTRCTNGWILHVTDEWAVSCPVCRPSDDLIWLAARDGEGHITHRTRLPADHPSQAITPMPAYVRDAARQYRAKRIVRDAALVPAYQIETRETV
jgi:hypothetical protein